MKSWIPWLLVGLAAGCAVDETRTRPNVLCVVVDSLRADEISADGTPAFDEIGRTGARFDRAYASSAWNMPAVASVSVSIRCRASCIDVTPTTESTSKRTISSSSAQLFYVSTKL